MATVWTNTTRKAQSSYVFSASFAFLTQLTRPSRPILSSRLEHRPSLSDGLGYVHIGRRSKVDQSYAVQPHQFMRGHRTSFPASVGGAEFRPRAAGLSDLCPRRREHLRRRTGAERRVLLPVRRPLLVAFRAQGQADRVSGHADRLLRAPPDGRHRSDQRRADPNEHARHQRDQRQVQRRQPDRVRPGRGPQRLVREHLPTARPNPGQRLRRGRYGLQRPAEQGPRGQSLAVRQREQRQHDHASVFAAGLSATCRSLSLPSSSKTRSTPGAWRRTTCTAS